MKKLISISLIIIGAVVLGIFFGNISESNTANIKTIGAILPLSGDLSTHGEEAKIATKLAVSHFNLHLQEIGEDWTLDIIIEDTATNPVIALEKLTSLHAKGIDIIIGPQSSAELRVIKGYADSNDITLISPSSTSSSLAIPGDNIYRLIPDDTKQGPALAKLIKHEGISILIPVWRGDTWGDGLHDSTIQSFEKLGGITDEGIRYNPESPEFSASTSLLSSKVSHYIDQYGKDNVGIVILGFSEVLHFMQSSAEHDVLDDIRWFGGDGNTKEEKLIKDPIGLEFSQSVQFTTTQVKVNNNPTYQYVKNHIEEKLGRTPNSYAFSSYDATMIAAYSILEDKSVAEIAENYSGAIGPTKLNAAGDLAQADYEIWGIRNAEWVLLYNYSSSDDSISMINSTN